MSDKLHINNEMAQLDVKNRHFYDELNEEERRKFSNYLMLRWGSSVAGNNGDLQSYYLQSTNQQVNPHFWSLNKHPKLQWLLMTTISPNMGVFKHDWIAYKGKAAKNKRAQQLAEIYPDMKIADAELLANTMTDDQYQDLLLDLGYTDKDIKEALK
jgi:hypothetical protein